MITHRRFRAGVTIPVLALFVACHGGRAAQGQELACRVARVSDGDSFYCEGAKRVRLTGIDAPELAQGAIGDQARAALVALMPPGAEVTLELDVAPEDRYGRTLAYVWRDGNMVNREMVRRGWAMLYTVPPNVRHVELLRAAQDSARGEAAGHWKDGGFTCPPAEHRRGRC